MSIQYMVKNADIVGTVSDVAGYNIGSSTDQLSVAIDGGSNQVFTLTHGATRTAAQIVTDLAGLTGATASVCTTNSSNYLRIRTTSANGASSSVLVNAPSNNANSALGLTAATWTGGTNVAYQFQGDTKQNLANGIEQGLNNAGWITISGHQSSSIVVQSAMTPPGQNLRIQVKITTANTNTVCVSIQNVSGSKVAVNGTNNGGLLLPMAGTGFKVLANKYQAFVFVPGLLWNFIAFGVPSLPSWLQGTIWEAAWLHGSGYNDTHVSGLTGITFRTSLTAQYASGGYNYGGNQQNLVNGSLWEMANNSLTGPSCQSLAVTHSAMIAQGGVGSTTLFSSLWHDLSAIMCDPIIFWGTTGVNPGDVAFGRGQLWDAFVSNDAYPCDTYLSSIDSHNWLAITNNNLGTAVQGSYFVGSRGTLFVVSP